MKLSKEQRAEIVREVQQYFRDEFDLELGELRAGLVADFFGRVIGPLHYNEAITDARALAADRAATTDEELFALLKEVDPGRRRPSNG